MQSSIDYSNDSYGVTVDRTGGAIKITFDIGTICSELYLSKEQSDSVAEQILHELGKRTSDEWEDEVYKLQEENNSLRETIEDYEERMEYMRRKEQYVPF
ncbi:hypothetical protein H8S10_15450 [Clostridium sp. NSJ-49]|uniref:hypothetical protein n=1 Tax=Clostridium TaxID=1485 RepID=UPI00164C1DD9|nr:hypothetical protein [Clostridium sp. NSJ-49]MBC5626837.1 hypothetical protein [Clostridium sp. NSJ-49]